MAIEILGFMFIGFIGLVLAILTFYSAKFLADNIKSVPSSTIEKSKIIFTKKGRAAYKVAKFVNKEAKLNRKIKIATKGRAEAQTLKDKAIMDFEVYK